MIEGFIQIIGRLEGYGVYHDQEVTSVFEMLDTSEAGSSSKEAERRLQEYRENKFEEKEKLLSCNSFSRNLKIY